MIRPAIVVISMLVVAALGGCGGSEDTGEYRFLKVRKQSVVPGIGYPQRHSETLTSEVEVWISPTQRYERATTVKAGFPTEADRRAWIADGRPQSEIRESARENFTYETFVDRERGVTCAVEPLPPVPMCKHKIRDPSLFTSSGLPTDPAALKAEIERQAAEDPGNFDDEVFTTAYGHLRNPLATAELRSSLVDLLTDLAGVSFVADRQDSTGRAATLISYETKAISFELPDGTRQSTAERFEIYVDPETSNVLEVRTSTGTDEPGPSSSQTLETFVERSSVDELPPEAGELGAAPLGDKSGATPPSAANGSPVGPVRTVTRNCASRVEGARLDPGHPTNIRVGPIIFYGLRGAAEQAPSEFTTTENGISDAWKTVTELTAGLRVTLTIRRADRDRLALIYGNVKGGRRRGYKLVDGSSAVRFEACPAGEPRFSPGAGTVGPRTQFNGGFIVGRPGCYKVAVRVNGRRRAFRQAIGFGSSPCPHR